MTVMKIKDACPICHGHVQGNPEIKFYCKHCNMLFKTSELESKTFKN